MVGSSIEIISSGSGFNASHIVSPISISSIPTIAQMSPQGTSSTSVLVRPSKTNICFGTVS